MTVRNRLCLRSAGSIFWLPPYNAELPRPRGIMNVMSRVIPFGAMEINYCRAHGFNIRVDGQYKFDNPRDGLLFERDLIAALFDQTGAARVVEYCHWTGDAAVPGVYRQCVATTWPEFTGKQQAARRYGIDLVSCDPVAYAAFENGQTPGVSPYESYVVSAEEGETAVPLQQCYPVVFTFGGMAAACGASNAAIMQKVWPVATDGTQVRIRSVAVVGCDGVLPGSTATVLRVGKEPYSSASNYIEITLAAGAGAAAAVSGSLVLNNGDNLYAWVHSSGGLHEGICLKAEAVSQ